MPVFSDGLGLSVTASSEEAAAAFGSTVDGYVRFTRDTGDRLKGALTADPDMPLAHVTKGYFMKLFGTKAMALRADKALGTAKELSSRIALTEREQGHLAALDAWCAGNIDGAADAWEGVLLDHPTDILALRLAHFAHFYAGDGTKMRDSVARVLTSWDRAQPLYGNLIGMYGFGLEESGDYRRGERKGSTGSRASSRTGAPSTISASTSGGTARCSIWSATSSIPYWNSMTARSPATLRLTNISTW